MTQTLQEFQDAFRISELTVYQNRSWTWSVRVQQPTLGSSVISLNRFAERLSDISEHEGNDLRDIIMTVEQTLQGTFGYEKINYLMLMMVDVHVHYHVIPRYGVEKSFDGHVFPDAGWPKFPDLTSDHTGGQPSVPVAIAAQLKTMLDKT